MGSCGTWDAKDFPEFVEYLSDKNILDQVPNYSVIISESELKTIKTRTLLRVGDNDHATPLECVIKVKSNMLNAFLWIVPNTEHRVHHDKNKDLFIKTSKEFLKNKNW